MDDSQTYPAPRSTAPEKVTDKRPWGGYASLVQNERCTVKVIWVDAGRRLSLQSHKLRSELWTVVQGSMEVELDGTAHTVGEGEQVFIPCGSKHRAIGLDGECRWVEIMFGHYDEEDIVRYEDDFGRA